MATPAAILGILVKASTTEANLALAKTDAQLSATAASAERTTAATSTAGANMKKMGTMAKLAGAAIAVGFVIEAKKAVQVTQDLTKSTISLHENLGIANKQASKWAAVAKARGVDTTKLGMAFKTFATQVDAATKGSSASIKMFDELGISQKDLASNQNNVQKLILQTADGIDQLGAGTKRTTAESKLFGRGWQTVAPLIRDGSAALKDNLDLTEKYGATLSGQTLKAQEELLANTRESKLAWMGIQISLAKFVTPALNVLEDQFQRVARIMGSDKLTDDEKFKKVAAIFEKDFQKALDVALGLIPEFASKVGEAAPKVALAFIQGFLNADGWGKLALGAWFFTKVGLTKAIIVTQAKKIGALFGLTFAAEAETGAAAGAGGGLLAALAPPAAAVGALALGLDKITKAREEAGQAQIEIVKQRGAFQQTIDKMKASYGSLTKAVGAASKDQQQSYIDQAQALADAGALSQKVVYRMQQAVNDSTDRQKQAWKDLADALGMTAKQVKNQTGSMARTFINDLTAMGETNASVLKAIADDTNAALRAFGVDEVTFRSGGIKSGATGPGHLGQRKQRGGMIGGTGTGDKVHVLAEPGEGFINSRAVKALGGKGAIDAINRAVPRFQKGGFLGNVIEALGPVNMAPFVYDPAHAGANRHLHLAMQTVGEIVAFGRKLVGAGYQVSENPAFGGVNAVHAPNSYHYSGQAIDINTAQDETIPQIRKVVQMLGGAAGAMAEKIKRVLITGPDGPWKGILQSSADKAVKGANAYIAKQMPTLSTTGTEGAGTLSAGQFTSIANRAIGVTGTKGSFNAGGLLSLAMQESGLRVNPPPPHDINWPSNPSMGLMQVTGSTFKAYHEPGTSSSIIDPLANIASSINYQLGQYGHQITFSPYAKGGVVPSFAGGGVVPGRGPMAAIVHGGERISPAGTPHVEVNVYGGMVEDVEVLIDGKLPEIANYVIREGGRNRARSRQLAGSAGRG